MGSSKTHTRMAKKLFCQRNGMNPKRIAFASPERTSSCTRKVLTNLKRLGPQNSIIDRLQQMAANVKETLGQSMHRRESMCLSRGVELIRLTFLIT